AGLRRLVLPGLLALSRGEVGRGKRQRGQQQRRDYANQRAVLSRLRFVETAPLLGHGYPRASSRTHRGEQPVVLLSCRNAHCNSNPAKISKLREQDLGVSLWEQDLSPRRGENGDRVTLRSPSLPEQTGMPALRAQFDNGAATPV